MLLHWKPPDGKLYASCDLQASLSASIPPIIRVLFHFFYSAFSIRHSATVRCMRTIAFHPRPNNARYNFLVFFFRMPF